MVQIFRNIQFESISFWSGFLTATLLWWLVSIARPSIKRGWSIVLEKIREMRESVQTNAEGKYRNDTIRSLQEMHLSAVLFSLDELIIEPRLLAPRPIVDPDSPPPFEDLLSSLIPYTPDQPEMATAYNAKTLDVIHTLEHAQNIAIISNPGMGKTTTLAYIASCLCRQSPVSGTLEDSLPIYIHLSDLNLLPKEDATPLTTMIEGLSFRIPAINPNRLTQLLNNHLEEKKIVLLLDGLDETNGTELNQGIDFLKSIHSTYPDIKTVVSADPHFVSDLPRMGYAFFSLAAWDSKTQAEFIQKWSYLWNKHIESPGRRWNDVKIDPHLINGWLLNIEAAETPLEFTLKVWAAYAGDSLGLRSEDAIEAYIRRLCARVPKSRTALALLASINALNMTTIFSMQDAKSWLSEGKKETEADKKMAGNNTTQEDIAVWDIDEESLPDLVEIGLLTRCPENKLRFSSPVIFSYLGGQTIPANELPNLLSQAPSAVKFHLLKWLAYTPELDDFIYRSLSGKKDPLLAERIIASLFIPRLPEDSTLVKDILTQLSKDIQNEMLPFGIRIRILTGLAKSGHPAIQPLFRGLLNAESVGNRQLAVLGCGYLRDLQAVNDLIKKLKDISIIGQASCFALVNIGTKPALEAVATELLGNDERLAQAAAEAFASNQKEGYPILKEGSEVENLLVRRAVIFGLRKVNEPWAIKILEKMQIEDSQWVIKDAATQAVDDLSKPDPSIPKQLLPLEDIPWLVSFAAERGLGISAGKPATQMLLRVLREGGEEEILAAIDLLRMLGEINIFPEIYTLYYDDNPLIKEASYSLLVRVSSMGVDIPPLDQVGINY